MDKDSNSLKRNPGTDRLATKHPNWVIFKT